MVYVLGAFSKPTGNKLIETSIDEGLSLLKLSADAGYWKAQLALADIYQSGSGKVKPDKVLSEKYFQLLSEQNNPEVIYQIACHYDLVGISIKHFGEKTHRGRRLDYEETNRIALEWYLKAAIKGHTESASSAGEFYLDGRGGVKDKQMAVRYFKQAAENGDFTSMLKLALAYLNGEGVTKDYAEAKKWFDKVAVINKAILVT